MKLRKQDEQPIIYLSGGHTSSTEQDEIKWLKKTNCRYRCYSFAYTCPGAFYYNKRMEQSLNISVKQGVGVFMDSGAFSFHKFVTSATGKISKSKRQTPEMVERFRDETIELYSEYAKKLGKKWDFYVNFDYVKHAPTCYKMQQLLMKRGLEPVPVFHGDDDIEWFERYCKDGHKLVGIGTMKVPARMNYRGTRRYYDAIFDIAEKYGVVLHGFAVTSLSLMFGYPWYSVDSATWVKVAAFGKIVYVDPVANTIGQIHVSKDSSRHRPSYSAINKRSQKELERQVESRGFDFEKVRTEQLTRAAYNAYMFNNELMHLRDEIRSQRIQWESIL